MRDAPGGIRTPCRPGASGSPAARGMLKAGDASAKIRLMAPTPLRYFAAVAAITTTLGALLSSGPQGRFGRIQTAS